MNRTIFSLAPIAAVCTALGQTPPPPPAAPVNMVTETSKVSRFVAGPGDRPQGFLLRNGTFVMLPPGLSQQLPSTISTDSPIAVTGDEYRFDGTRTIQARRIVIAGTALQDGAPAAAAPAPPPPPRPAAPPLPPGRAAGPAGRAAAAPPPAPCPASSAPNPPAPPNGAVPPAPPPVQ